MGSALESGLAMVVVSGPTEVERVVFGFASALAATATGIDVRVFLTDEGTFWAMLGTGSGEHVPDFPTIDELLGELCALGVGIEACSESLALQRSSAAPLRLRPGIRELGRELLIREIGLLRSVVC